MTPCLDLRSLADRSDSITLLPVTTTVAADVVAAAAAVEDVVASTTVDAEVDAVVDAVASTTVAVAVAVAVAEAARTVGALETSRARSRPLLKSALMAMPVGMAAAQGFSLMGDPERHCGTTASGVWALIFNLLRESVGFEINIPVGLMRHMWAVGLWLVAVPASRGDFLIR